MKIHFYTIIDPYKEQAYEGGGPETYRQIINNCEEVIGQKNVKLITPTKEWASPKEADLCIYQDIFNDPGSTWFTSQQYEELHSHPNFIISECAYTLCTNRPYALNNEMTNPVYDQTPFYKQISNEFLHRAKRVLVTSPLHGNEIQKFVKADILGKTYHYLQEIDTKKFYKMSPMTKDIEYLYAGAEVPAKGVLEARELFGEKLTLFTNNNPVKNHLMVYIYNKSKTFVHLPRWKEPFSRTVAEALLCGCKLISNENVGCLSYGKDLSDPNTYKESKNNFKKFISGLL